MNFRNLFLTNKEVEEETLNLPIFREYAINFNDGEYIDNTDKNDILILEKNEALKVWIFKALKTERNRYEIHSESYGTDLYEHPGTIYNKTIKDALMINQIKDTLLVNPYILECYDFTISNEDEYIPEISFKVRTIYGEVEIKNV